MLHSRRNTRNWSIAAAATVVVAAGAVGVGVGVRGGSGSGTTTHAVAASKSGGDQSAARAAAAQAQLTSAVTFSPAGSTTAVPLDAPVSVQTALGTIRDISVQPATGPALTGAVAQAGQRWVSAGPLAPSTTYTISGTVGSGPTQAPFHSTFTTVTPTALVKDALLPNDGTTVGVGQPVVVKFTKNIPAASQAAVLSHFTVTETAPVAGGWHWFSSRELHFRPQAFWPTGEQITVASNLDGWDVGSGMWGTGTDSVHFVVGASHVAVANLSTERMTVSQNGAVIATYPISAGSTQYPTMNGIHIAMDKESVVHMVSSTVGIPVSSPNGYDEMVYNDVHISDSGEYVHDAPWSVGSQGRHNVSHGCINLSPTDSKAFFDFSQNGDVIEVVGGPRPPLVGDHGVMDWSTDWSQFTPGTVTPATPPPAATPATTAPATTAPPAG